MQREYGIVYLVVESVNRGKKNNEILLLVIGLNISHNNLQNNH